MPDPTRSAAPDPATPSGAGTRTLAGAGTRTLADALAPPVSAGRYELGGEIARGGMGVVYRATDTAFAREVAVKVLLDKFGAGSGAARRFADEARITGQLQHPAIPPVHDVGTLPDGRPFLAMKLIKGDSLDDLLKARPDPSAERGRFVAAFEQVCQAVAYAHAHQVIHRDLKPANVMVGNFGEVQVMDWGLAKVLGTREAEAADPDETSGGTAIQSLRESGGAFTASPVMVGDHILATNETGRTYIFKANPKEFELESENQLGAETFATPTVCGGRIYLRVAVKDKDGRQEKLVCVGEK